MGKRNRDIIIIVICLLKLAVINAQTNKDSIQYVFFDSVKVVDNIILSKKFQDSLIEDFTIINHMYNQTKLIVREIAKVNKVKYNFSSIRSWKSIYIIEYSLPYDGPQEHPDGSVTMIDDGVVQIYVDKKSEKVIRIIFGG